MIRIIGNPYPVLILDSHCTDRSDGYDESVANEYNEIMAEGDPKGLKPDVDILVQECADQGYAIDHAHAYYAWMQYSDSRSAHWLNVASYKGALLDYMQRFLIIDDAE